MEIKKSKGANLENHRLTYLLMGFVFALSAIYVCFEYTDKEIEIYDNQTVAEIIEEDIQIDQTIQEETPPPPPEPEEIPDVIEEIKVVEDDVKVESVDFNSEDKKDEVVVFHEMPKVEEGDILCVYNTGAYNYSMASNYNRVEKPAMVLVNNSHSDIIVYREMLDDLISKDNIPDRLRKYE